MNQNKNKKKLNKSKFNTVKQINSISYIFPVFNEESRLPFLFNYIKKRIKRFKNAEIIFIDDGSKDNSKKLILDFIHSNIKFNKFLKLISYKKNKGKGHALKKGVLASKREWILTLDTDLSVNFSQIDLWIKKKYLYKEKNYAYFGSRIIKGSEVKALFIRKFIGQFFRIFQNLIIRISLKDTQCGFKLYRNSYSKEIFSNLQTLGFAHDVELIYLLQRKNIKIIELPVRWTHKSGSKINIMLDSLKMVFEILKIKLKFNNQ